MMIDGPVFTPGVKLGAQMAKMEASGVGSVRVAFIWSQAQPYARWSDVPRSARKRFSRGPGGVPTSYFETDRVVEAAARDHLSVLPVVTYAPSWDGLKAGDHVQPAHTAPYAHYLTGLVKRYGRHGTFWSSLPRSIRRPITSWEIWNEPDLSQNWNTTPFAPSYVRLLRAAHAAIKRVDRSAKVILAAMTNYGWQDLAAVYKVPGSRSLFDVVAANPYTALPAGVITILGYFRHVMDRHGDGHKSLIATEIGWPSALGKATSDFGINTTEKGQAKKLAQLLPLLAASRQRLHLNAFYYYTWMSTDPHHGVPFQYAGLLRFNPAHDRISAKPAYLAFRRTVLRLESCPGHSGQHCH